MPLKSTVVLYIGLIVMMFTTIQCILPEQNTFASPPIARQETRDTSDKSRDLVDLIESIKKGKQTYVIPEYVIDKSIDIESFSYFSNGKVLNATLSFASPTDQSHLMKDTNEIILDYGMLIDVDNSETTGWKGIDYRVEIEWNSTDNKWKKIFEEQFARGVSTRKVDDYTGDPGLFNKSHGYVTFSADLDKMGSPDEYRVVFYAKKVEIDKFRWIVLEEEKPVRIVDFTDRVRIPLPEVSISMSQDPVIVIAGESTDVVLQVKSNTRLPLYSSVKLLAPNPDELISINLDPCVPAPLDSSAPFRHSLLLNPFDPLLATYCEEEEGEGEGEQDGSSTWASGDFDSSGTTRFPAEVRVERNAAGSYPLEVSGNAIIPNEHFTIGIFDEDESATANETPLGGDVKVIQLNSSDLKIEVQDWAQKFRDFITQWEPLVAIILAVTTLIGGLKIWDRLKTRKRKERRWGQLF